MFLLSTPRVRIAGGDCGLLGEDPAGIHGRPHSTEQSMSSVDKFRPFSPNCVRWLVITTYNALPDGSLFVFQGLDAVGQWWYGASFVNKGKLIPSSEPGSDDRSWFTKAVDAVAEAVIKYGVPIVAAALAATGVGGLVAAGALLAWRNLAMGQSLTDAVLNAQQATLAKSSPSALDAFNQGLAKAKEGLSDKALQAALASLPSAATNAEIRKTFYEAVTLVRAQQTQDLTVAVLNRVLSGDEVNRLALALKWGAPLSDVMTALHGQAGDKVLLSTTQAASGFVASHVESPEKIQAAIADPSMVKVASTSTGGGASSSSGPGVGTAVVVGAGGYALYKLWPKIMSHFAHPGERKRR